MNDPIADLLTRIRNAQKALLPATEMPHSKVKESILKVLKAEGYIADFSVDGKTIKTIKVKLKYAGKQGVVDGLKRISKPGLRHYVAATEIPRVRGGLGLAVVSTSQGIMSGTQARKQNMGGELLCYVW
jgi:small subunit ribosomal protein S8